MTNSLDKDYWVHKLVPFKHGFRLFPPYLRGQGEGREELLLELHPDHQSQDPALYLSALALVLCRYTANEEVLIASELVGQAVPPATSPIFYRCAYNADWTVDSFHQHIQAEMETVRSHQAYSFPDVTAQLGIGSDALELFRVGYAFVSDNHSPALDHRPSFLIVVQSGRCIDLSFDAIRYPADFMRQFAQHYVRALDYLLGSGDILLRDLDLLSETEKSVLVCEFNRTQAAYPRDMTLHALFEEQARRTPDAQAVVYENKSLTYRELNQHANRLAHYLRETLGVKTGDPVGVLTGRSERMIVALLAVIKAGAAYVPINPKHPWETVNYMIENAGIRVLLVNSDTVSSVATFRGELFALDAELDALTTSMANPEVIVSGGELAYAIYTSGSTGRPKCVAVEHHAIVNTILWRNRYYGIDHRDRNLQMPSFSFDSSVLDIFCFLAAGGALIIPDEDLRLDPHYLRELIKTHGVSRFIVTSSYYKVLVGELKGLTSLRSITVAGESTNLDLVSGHHASLPGVPLINEYGPTENAVCSTACVLHQGDNSVPIGRPVSNVKIFIVDESMRLTPIGVPGEILLGGDGLARGYLNQPDLTAERFIPSPIPAHYEGRLYRTGDLACWRSDGMLEFQGRIDRQVKVRGFRIELGEIETVLLKNPACDNVVVLCKDDSSGNKYLAAYVASKSGVDVHCLSGSMRDSLPYYMVPDAITVMPGLPVNLNGKVDVAYLRALDDFGNSGEAPARPRTAQEEALLGVCANVFKRPGLGIDDNFFAVGANSLGVMELITRIRNKLDIGIEFLDVYNYPTVRELALKLGSLPGAQSSMTADFAGDWQ